MVSIIMVGLFLWSPNPPLPWRWSSPPGVAALPPFRPSAGRRLGCFLDISIVLCSWRRLFALLFGVRWARSLRQGQAPLARWRWQLPWRTPPVWMVQLVLTSILGTSWLWQSVWISNLGRLAAEGLSLRVMCGVSSLVRSSIY
jgi:hypothetical protein